MDHYGETLSAPMIGLINPAALRASTYIVETRGSVEKRTAQGLQGISIIFIFGTHEAWPP